MQTVPELPRRLGLADATSIVVGVIIGAGIFLVPSIVARNVPTARGIIAVWVAGGLLSFVGALAMAELGAMMPATGGQYVFLREAYGPMAGFLCGWASLLTSQSAAIAWLGVSFSIYLGYFVTVPPSMQKPLAVVVIGLVAVVNYRGVRLGAAVQKTLTLAKVLALAVLIGGAFLAKPAPTHAAIPAASFAWSGFGAGLLAALLSYDGWAAVSFISGEIREPRKNVFRALAFGMVVCIVIYGSVNLAYMRTFTAGGMGSLERIGAALGERTLGPAGGGLVAAAILVSIAGAINGWIMTTPRMYFAQARDGLFFRRFGEIHPRFETPAFAIVMQFLWSAVLIATGSFEVLISLAMFSLWLFYGFTVAGLIVLRIKRRDVVRPYRMWGYPVTPVLFVLVATWFVVNTLIEQPGPSLSALGIILAGLPAYFLWQRKATRAVAQGGEAALVDR
jgi:APA family basic amino acid/polyamine antiporter